MSATFEDRIDKTGHCWEWIGPKDRDGYGQLTLGKRGTQVRAHRYSWELSNGPIPEGMFVLHRCDNPSCVNPRHLFLGTQTDNMRDMVAKGRGPDVSGESNPRAKLSREDVRQIIRHARHVPHHKGLTHQELAKRFGVSKSLISQIAQKRIWREIAHAN